MREKVAATSASDREPGFAQIDIGDLSKTFGSREFVLVLDQVSNESELVRHLASPRVRALLVDVECTLPDGIDGARVGHYDPSAGRWRIPKASRAVIVAPNEMPISLPMAVRAIRAGCSKVAYPANDGAWQQVSLWSILVRRMASVLHRAVIKQDRAVWRRARAVLGASRPTLARRSADGAESEADLAASAGLPDGFTGEAALLAPDEFQPNRILMINSALAWGGAERQLVNSMIGLKGRGFEVDLVCEALGYVPDSEFFRWRLEEMAFDISSIRRSEQEFEGQISPILAAGLLKRVSRLPPPLDETVAPYALEMLARRPGIVHAWQDQTSVAAGVAAVMVGVPKIVLSTRNVSPPNFAYFQPHMDRTYRSLLGHANLCIINNSKAGCEDYSQWLGVDRSDFRLLYNGIDFGAICKPAASEVADFRRRVGLPDGRPVIGGIFRLYEEKDPELWVRTAARVAAMHPDAVFMIIGVGPMREQLLELADGLGLANRLLLPGTEKRPEVPLATMDVFLLTSRFEGLPNVVIEAQSQGVPVVTTSAGGSGEAILNGETGWLVEDRDPAQLADRVSAVLGDRTWAANARRRAPEFAEERFGFDRMIDETIEIYNSI